MAKKKMLFKFLGVAAGLAFTWGGLTERSELSRMRSVGKAAVVDPISTYSKGKSFYSAQFSFTTDQGEKVSRYRSFPSELLADFESGRPVIVLYDPKKPEDFIFEKEKMPWVMVLGGIVFAILALLFA